MEFGGDTCRPTIPGRVIKFPNSKCWIRNLQFTWPLFRYVGRDQVHMLRKRFGIRLANHAEVAEKELGEAMMERVKVYRELLLKPRR